MDSLSYKLERRYPSQDQRDTDAYTLPKETRNNLILMGRQNEPHLESPSTVHSNAFATYSEMPEGHHSSYVPPSDRDTIYTVKHNVYNIRFRLDPKVDRDTIHLTDDHLEDTIKVTFRRNTELKEGKHVLSTEINRVFKLYRTDVDVHRTNLSIHGDFVHLDAPFKVGQGMRR